MRKNTPIVLMLAGILAVSGLAPASAFELETPTTGGIPQTGTYVVSNGSFGTTTVCGEQKKKHEVRRPGLPLSPKYAIYTSETFVPGTEIHISTATSYPCAGFRRLTFSVSW